MKKYPLFTFCAINGLLWGAVSLVFFCINGFFTDGFGIAFTAVFIVGHMFLFAWALGLLCWPWRWVGGRTLPVVSIALTSFFTSLLATDLLVFSQYRFHVGLAMLELFLGPAGKEIFVFPASMWVLAGAVGLLIIALETGLWIFSSRKALTKKGVGWILAVWGVCFVFYNGLYAWGKFMLVPSIMSQRKVLPLAYPLSANRRLEAWGLKAPQNPYFLPKKGTLSYSLAPLVCSPSEPQKNILILLIDSWRADSLEPQIMPVLSSWADRPGMSRFTNHISGGHGTDSGVFSLFYSLPQTYWEDVTALHLPPVLVSYALERGYIPAIFASSKLTSPTFNRNVFAAVPELRVGSKGNSSWERDEDAVKDFEQFLQERETDKPFFGFIFLDAPHGYSYPSEDEIFTPAKAPNYMLLTNNTDPTPYVNQYKNAVHFADRMVGRVLEALEKKRILQDTVIILTGDHGQELNDSKHNFWGHNGNLTDYQTKVPLLVYRADTSAATQKDYRTTHYDIVPTLLQDVFKCTNSSSDYSMGYNLFDDTPRIFSLLSGHTEKALRVGDDIFVLDNFGGVSQYNSQYGAVSKPIAPSVIKEGLQSFRRFYK